MSVNISKKILHILQKTNGNKVLISYAWENQSIAKSVYDEIKRAGIRVFADFIDIDEGTSVPTRISEGLKWCNTLVLLWSSDAAKSTYVEMEWGAALHLEKRIIACVLDKTELPAILQSLHYANFSEN